MNVSLPKAYKDGFCDFYGRDFIVSPDVLIPRPETEMMIDSVLALAGRSYLPGVKSEAACLDDDFTILDVGTGSGCIAITLALEFPNTKVLAVDISEKALKVAQKNADKFGAKVRFLKSDLFSAVPEEIFRNNLVITANLPYVDENWEWLDKENLAYEPEIALYSENRGLAHYQRFFNELQGLICGKMDKKFIQTCGKLFVVIEADTCQHDELKQYAESRGFRHIITRGFALTFCAQS